MTRASGTATFAFGRLGNTWADTEDLSVSTGYGISYTSRDETARDTGKDDRFGGVRLDGDYHHRLGDSLELDSDWRSTSTSGPPPTTP